MDNQFLNSGEIAIIDSTTIEISELPVKTWTQVGLQCQQWLLLDKYISSH